MALALMAYLLSGAAHNAPSTIFFEPVNVRDGVPVAVALAVSVTCDELSTLLILVLAGMPAPVQDIHRNRSLVLGRFVTTALPLVVFPVRTILADPIMAWFA